ncbi:MAG TPA: hypothetical protein VF177_03965, partial [Anaerolineae bacterium]
TGEPVSGYTPITLGPINPTAYALSAGGQKLAVLESRGTNCESYAGGTACRASADVLHLVDIPARREVTANLPGTDWVWLLAFSPDATRLALVQNERESSTVVVYDTDTGELVAQQVLDFRPSLIAYAQVRPEQSQSDELALAIYGQPLGSPPGMGQPGSPRVLLADATTLEILWDQPLENIVSGYWCLEKCEEPHGEQLFAEWNPAVIPSLDGQRLYIVHANTEWLTTVDFNTRSVSSVEIQAAQSWFERLLALTAGVAEAKGGVTGATKEGMFSPDGKQLYIVTTAMNSTRDANGNWNSLETNLDLQVVAVDNGRKITGHDVEVTGSWISADIIQFTPDGAHILVGGWSDGQRWAQVLDAKSLEPVVHLMGWEVMLSQRMDGQPVILGSRHHNGRRVEFALLDSRSFDIADSWTISTNASWLAP